MDHLVALGEGEGKGVHDVLSVLLDLVVSVGDHRSLGLGELVKNLVALGKREAKSVNSVLDILLDLVVSVRNHRLLGDSGLGSGSLRLAADPDLTTDPKPGVDVTKATSEASFSLELALGLGEEYGSSGGGHDGSSDRNERRELHWGGCGQEHQEPGYLYCRNNHGGPAFAFVVLRGSLKQ